MTSSPPPDSNKDNLPVRRARVEGVTLYECKDEELDILERGSPSSTYFNIGIFALGNGLTGAATLATATLTLTYLVFFMVWTVFGLGAGSILLAMWYRSSDDDRTVIRRIRSRLKDAGAGLASEAIADPNSGEGPPKK